MRPIQELLRTLSFNVAVCERLDFSYPRGSAGLMDGQDRLRVERTRVLLQLELLGGTCQPRHRLMQHLLVP